MQPTQSKLIFLLIALIILMLYPQAQDERLPYDIALQRMEDASLNNMTELDLSELDLAEIPPKLWELGDLQILSLHNNQLSIIPSDIAQLQNLRELNLHSNQLTQLNPAIGQLTALEYLNVSHNNLSEIPVEIGQLEQLQVLSLYENDIVSLPDEIGQLSNLCYLELGNNHLRHLPTTMSKLKSLLHNERCTYQTGFYIEGNPLVTPPREVVEQGTEAILDYLGNQAWYHTQRLIQSVLGLLLLSAFLMVGFWFKQQGMRKVKAKQNINN